MSMPMRPMIGLSGSPLPVSRVQVLAPSVVFQIPLPGPPPLKPQGWRRRWYDAANSTFGIRGIHDDVGEAGVVVDELGVRPGLAAVGRLVEPALRVRSEQMPDRRDVDDVRVLRVDDDAADALGFLQPDVHELLAAVGGLVDAGAERRALAVVRLAGADVDDVRVRRRERDVADRRHRILVEDGVQVVPLLVVFQMPPVAKPT